MGASDFNTQYMTNPTIVSQDKMEYGKWCRRNFVEIPPTAWHFLLNEFTLQKGGILIKSTNSVIKMTW